jgi:curli biogenesis system outer membrane secretion channel CsgG
VTLPRLVPIILCASLVAGACASVDETQVVDPGGPPETSPTLEQDQKHVLKRRVAIARFDNQTLYGKSVLLLREADFLANQASDILATRLAESGKFVVMEYSDSKRLLDVLDHGLLADEKVPADLLIVGSVTEFGRETTGERGVFSRTKIQRARARVAVRLVDVRTARVLFASEGAGAAESEAGTTLGVGTDAGYDSSLNDRAVSAAIAKVVGNIMERMLEQPWRSYVLAVEGESIVIAGGKEQGIVPGDRFSVLRRGRQVENPQTGVPVELPGTQVAVLEVVETFGDAPESEGARCSVVSGEVPTEDLTELVVREVES